MVKEVVDDIDKLGNPSSSLLRCPAGAKGFEWFSESVNAKEIFDFMQNCNLLSIFAHNLNFE